MDISRIKEFFFKAMIEGWAEGGKKQIIPDLPGFKAIPFRADNFYLLDMYSVTQDSLKSAGTTTIWYENVPVWTMQYAGYYEKDREVIAFLKRALLKNYQNRNFIGGRGPNHYVEKSSPLLYRNVAKINRFDDFVGREEICDVKGSLRGFHEYAGFLLI